MRNGNKAPKRRQESQPNPPADLAVDWLRNYLPGGRLAGQANGQLPRWDRVYDDGSQLKLFLDPEGNIEVGHYSFPPGKYLVRGCNQENLDRYSFVASVIHEFLPDWYRSDNLLYASEAGRPAHVFSSQQYGIFRDYRYMLESWSPVMKFGPGPTPEINYEVNKKETKERALEQLFELDPAPLPVSPGSQLIEAGHESADTPRLTDWLRPIMHEHHKRHLPAKIRVGYYGPVDGRSDNINAQKDYENEETRSLLAAQVLAEFMPGWEVCGNRLIPEGFRPPDTMEEDGYRVCRWLVKDYLTHVEPWRDHERDLIPRYWANLTFFEMRDQALFGRNGRTYSLPYDIIDQPASVWARTYTDGSQLRLVYEPDWHNQNGNKYQRIYNKDHSGEPISRERLDIHDKIALELISMGIVEAPPQGQSPPILKPHSLQEAKDQGVAFFWSVPKDNVSA